MNKQILTSVFVICLIVLAAGAGTYAHLRDTEESTGNMFVVGTLDLALGDQNENFRYQIDGDSVNMTWTATNMKPGDIFRFYLPWNGTYLANMGTIDADHLEITCDFTVNPNNNMSKYMVITRAEYYNGDYMINLITGEYAYETGFEETPSKNQAWNSNSWRISDVDGDGRITFFDLKEDTLDDLPPVNGLHQFEMDVKFYEGAGNEFQGKIFNLTMIFTLNQHHSQ